MLNNKGRETVLFECLKTEAEKMKYASEAALQAMIKNVKTALGGKADTDTATASSDGLMSKADKAGLDKLSAVNIVTLSSGSWSGSAPYTQTVEVSGMTAESVPVWGLYGTPTEAVYEAYCNITSMATSADAVTFTCVSDKPASDVQIVIKGL